MNTGFWEDLALTTLMWVGVHALLRGGTRFLFPSPPPETFLQSICVLARPAVWPFLISSFLWVCTGSSFTSVQQNGPYIGPWRKAPVHLVAQLCRSSWMSLDNLWGISLHWERTSECILRDGKPWNLWGVSLRRVKVSGMCLFLVSYWSVHHLSLPTVVFPWNSSECSPMTLLRV